jgi:hypothetical protein
VSTGLWTTIRTAAVAANFALAEITESTASIRARGAVGAKFPASSKKKAPTNTGPCQRLSRHYLWLMLRHDMDHEKSSKQWNGPYDDSLRPFLKRFQQYTPSERHGHNDIEKYNHRYDYKTSDQLPIHSLCSF